MKHYLPLDYHWNLWTDSSSNGYRDIKFGTIYVLKNSKVSVVFSLDHKPGSLHDCLKSFRASKINLTKIQSRPSKKNDWDYLFFIDFLVEKNSLEAQKCLKTLRGATPFLKVLGVFTWS